jgi:pimeloyl-ACP methyl ester carboxylesterase
MELVVDGKTVRVATGGRPLDPGRPLLVLIHGAGMDHTVWSLTMRALAHDGYSVLAPDLPGHGASDGPAPETVEEYATWLSHLVAVTGFDRAHVVGHSLGSLIALQFAASYRDETLSLSLLATAASMPVHPAMQEAADAGDHLAIDLIVSWGLAPPAHLGRHPTPGMTLREAGMRLMERTAAEVIASDLRASSRYEGAIQAAAAVTCPTLLVLGTADRMTPSRRAAPLGDALEDVRVEVLPGTGHSMMLENPNGVLDALLDFLAAVNR